MKKELLTHSSFKRKTVSGWSGYVYYRNEQGERKRKCFSGTTKKSVNAKIDKYIEDFKRQLEDENEAKKKLKDSMQKWLDVFKKPSIESTTYDIYNEIAKLRIYPIIGDRIVEEISSTDVKLLLNYWMNDGKAYSTVRKVYILLNEYYRRMFVDEHINKNPMENVQMIKKELFFHLQGKENKPPSEMITVFTKDEIERFKTEVFTLLPNGKRKYQYAAAYILLLNTGMRIGELLGLLNEDIDMEKRTAHIKRTVKKVDEKTGDGDKTKTVLKVGKTKTRTSNRIIPLNNTAMDMIKDLRDELFLGENTPLICDEKGNFIPPDKIRKRLYKIEENANIDRKGLHAFRHTFATNLINGIEQPDGTLKTLNIKAVSDILGHSTTQITELYYVKKDNERLKGIIDGFEL